MEINLYQREKITPFLIEMNRWCMRQLKNYPYFYVPPETQLINPSDIMYVNDPDALLVIAKNQEEIISVATGIPLNSSYLTSYYFSPEIIDQFKDAGSDPKKIWYMGYFLLAEKYRDDHALINAIYEKFIAQVLNLNCNYISYVNVPADASHPLKPKNYRYMEPWGDVIQGFEKTPVVTQANWPTLQVDGSVKENEHQIIFMIKMC